MAQVASMEELAQMKELRELCRSGKDLKLSPTAVEDSSLLQILDEHSYVRDPSDRFFFVHSPDYHASSLVPYMHSDYHHPIAPVLPVPHGPPPPVPPKTIQFFQKLLLCSKRTVPLDTREFLVHRASQCESQSPAEVPDESWRPCHSIQADNRTEGFKNLQITLPNEVQHSPPEQRIVTRFSIEPRICITPANVKVLFRINTFTVGAVRPLKSHKAVGFYPVRIKLWIEPKLDKIAVPICNKLAETDGSTRTRKRDTKISAQLGIRPAVIKGESSWGTEDKESMHMEIVTTGDVEDVETGNSGVLEWKLNRWSHNEARYNENKPHSGSSPSALKGPFPGGRMWVNVENFPDLEWHLHPSMGLKFPLTFKLRGKVEMHVLWFEGRNPRFRAAEWKGQILQLPEKEFLVTDGINSHVPDYPLILNAT